MLIFYFLHRAVVFNIQPDVERLVGVINVFTTLYLLWVVSFNCSGKILYFKKNVTFFILHGCFQPCSLVNLLSKRRI